MAVVVTIEVPGGSQELQRGMMQDMGIQSAEPPGLRFRTQGPIPGGWRVVTGWDSPADFQRFRDEKLMPAFEKQGITPSRVEVWPTTSIDVIK
jgi:hypothetical protein